MDSRVSVDESEMLDGANEVADEGDPLHTWPAWSLGIHLPLYSFSSSSFFSL